VNMIVAEHLASNPQLGGEAFNFSNEIQVTVLELVQKLISLMKSDLQPDIRGEATNEIRHQYLSAAKAREVLGWKALFTLDEGLRRTVDWQSQQSDCLKTGCVLSSPDSHCVWRGAKTHLRTRKSRDIPGINPPARLYDRSEGGCS